MSTTLQMFSEVMRSHYQVSNLVGMNADEFRRKLESLITLQDSTMEGFMDETKQRDLSIRFHWGHDHDFGDFKIPGRLGKRHLTMPANFVDHFKVLPIDLTGKRILDIGVWTGGSSLLLCALGAEVVAIEEVKKYADAVDLLKLAFDIKKLTVFNKSLYDLNDPQFFDQFDYVLFAGVLYHVTDPVIALRIVFNCLKDGGMCLIESFATRGRGTFWAYHGPNVFGEGRKEDLSRSGWNWFVPTREALQRVMIDVGFEIVRLDNVQNQRISGIGKRKAYTDMLRAGLSVRNIR